ncbi:Monothiol glutaredoxin-S1 [Linum perenne]
MEQIARLVGDRPVVIFSRSSCDMCHTIKALISGYGANPTVYELDQMAEGVAIPNGHQIESALVQLGCQPSVPAVFIGQKLVGSEKQVMSLHVQNQLVPMLMQAGAIWLWK